MKNYSAVLHQIFACSTCGRTFEHSQLPSNITATIKQSSCGDEIHTVDNINISSDYIFIDPATGVVYIYYPCCDDPVLDLDGVITLAYRIVG